MVQSAPKWVAPAVFSWRKVLNYGLIGGVAILYVALVGMVDAFDERDVIYRVLTLGRALLLGISLSVGYVAAWKLSDGLVWKAVVSGILVGLIGSLMVALLVVLTPVISLREMFVNASPALLKVLTFSQESQTTGLLMLIGISTLISLLGAGIYLMPPVWRRVVIVGIVTTLLAGMLEELLNVNILSRLNALKPVGKFLYAREGLSITGAITVFLVSAGLSFLWRTQEQTVKKQIAQLPPAQQRAINWVVVILAVILLLLLPQITGSYITQIAVTVGLYVLMGLGLNIDIGLAGLLDLGFVGFFAIGAYVVALLTSTGNLGVGTSLAGEAGVSFWLAVPLAIVVASLFGVFLGIPVLRMRGDYLAIVTLGFAEIIRILVLSDFLRPVLGGAQGILNIPKPDLNLFGWDLTIKDPMHFYYLIVIGCVIIAFVAIRLKNSRVGRNWMAMREDEDVAEATGINLIGNKLLAFGIGAGFAGLSGSIFAAQLGSVFPHSFALLVSINVLSLIIVGGLGSIPGVVVGSLILVGLPELLREFSEFRLLLYGMLLVVMMLVKPEGFWPSEATRRELHEEEVQEEADSVVDSGEPAWKMGETTIST